MELGEVGLYEQPFRTHGRPLVFVRYASQYAATEFLRETYANPDGLGLFQGPSLSGKTTIIRHFAESQTGDAAVAVVDGAGLNTTALLEAVLCQFGYDLQFNSVNELLNMVKVFVMQQTASGHPPLLIIENTHALNPSALRALCELAELRVKHLSALRVILASDRSISSIVAAPAMAAISGRLTGDVELEPLTALETTEYLHAKLRAGGCIDPLGVLPNPVCDELYEASGGWPGIIDRLALLALAKADQCPVRKKHIERPLVPSGTILPEIDDFAIHSNGAKRHNGAGAHAPPRLVLTYNGRSLNEIAVDRPRLLVGRSDHNDLCVSSRYISRHHAMFVRHGTATFLMDLNSTNGTYVNSQRISNHVLIDEDIISIGNHGIRFHDANARDRTELHGAGFADTVIMRNIADMRLLLARENTESLPIPAKAALLTSVLKQ